MRDGVLIGIDAGTSVIKSVAFTTAGEQIGHHFDSSGSVF